MVQMVKLQCKFVVALLFIRQHLQEIQQQKKKTKKKTRIIYFVERFVVVQ